MGAWSFLLIALLFGCDGNSSKNDAQEVPAVPQGVVIGHVIQVKMGPDLRGAKTMVIVTDKGAKEGISNGTRGFIRVHEAALNEFRVHSVSHDSCQLQGWYYETIRPGEKIVFNVGNLPDDEVWSYFK
jgi:hypothetical protein